jgi:hypothetical protein
VSEIAGIILTKPALPVKVYKELIASRFARVRIDLNPQLLKLSSRLRLETTRAPFR